MRLLQHSCLFALFGLISIAFGVPVEEISQQPIIQFISKDLTIKGRINQDVTLYCSVRVTGNPLVHIWSRLYDNPAFPEQVLSINLLPFGPAKGYSFSQTTQGDVITYELTIRNATAEHSGVYSCKYTQDTSQTLYKVVILSPPIVQVENNFIKTTKGEEVELTCTAPNSTDTTITWSRTGQLAFPPVSANGSTIKFIASQEYNGEFVCTATNEVGNSSAVVTLDVTFAPMIVLTDKVIEESDPDRRDVICAVYSNPEPDFSLIRYDGEAAKTRYDDDDVNKNLKVYRLVYHVNNKNDFGEFTCQASNSVGKTTAKHVVTETRMPPPKPEFVNFPTSNQVSQDYEIVWNVNSDTKVVRFEVLIEKKISDDYFERFDNRTYTVATEQGPEYVGRIFVNHLNRDQIYRITVKVFNSYSLESENQIEFTVSENNSASSSTSSILFHLCLFVALFEFVSRQRRHI